MRTDDEERIKVAEKEFTILKNLRHQYISEAKGFFFDENRNTVYLVQELVDGKQLEDLVLKKGPFTGKKVCF